MVNSRVAVYDSGGNLLGYKVDIAWHLSPDSCDAKHHELVGNRTDPSLLKNLIFILNNPKGFLVQASSVDARLKRDHLVVVAESLTGSELCRHEIRKNPSGKYALV